MVGEVVSSSSNSLTNFICIWQPYISKIATQQDLIKKLKLKLKIGH